MLGGGIFVTTVVTGSVMVTGEFQLMCRPILRDIIFYIGAVYMVWFFIFRGFFQIDHSIGNLKIVCLIFNPLHPRPFSIS